MVVQGLLKIICKRLEFELFSSERYSLILKACTLAVRCLSALSCILACILMVLCCVQIVALRLSLERSHTPVNVTPQEIYRRLGKAAPASFLCLKFVSKFCPC